MRRRGGTLLLAALREIDVACAGFAQFESLLLRLIAQAEGNGVAVNEKLKLAVLAMR